MGTNLEPDTSPLFKCIHKTGFITPSLKATRSKSDILLDKSKKKVNNEAGWTCNAHSPSLLKGEQNLELGDGT